jgi:glutathione S-transferase
MRLITIRPSHYNEKARWALDRFGLEYDEEPWMPALHFAGTIPLSLRHRSGQADRGSSRFSTPMLVTDDANDPLLTDSSAIVRFASQRGGADPGFWAPEATVLDRHFSGRFGADTRRLVYWFLLPNDALLAELADRSVEPGQARTFKRLAPLIRKVLIRRLKVTQAHAERSRQNVLAEFTQISERLSDGRRYLVGDQFSIADLSFAALAALVVRVQPHEGYGAWLPALDQGPPEFGELATQLRATLAGEFVLRMFAEERKKREPRDRRGADLGVRGP